MAEKKTSAKKTGTGTKKPAPRKKKAKKPKVKLSARKVYILCAVIVGICALSLALSVITAAPRSQEPTSVVQKDSAPTAAPQQPAASAAQSVKQQPAANVAQSSKHQPAASAAQSGKHQPAANVAQSSKQQPAASAAQSAKQQPAASAAQSSKQQPAASVAQSGKQQPAANVAQSSKQQPAASAAQSAKQQPAANVAQSSKQQPAASAAQSAKVQPSAPVVDKSKALASAKPDIVQVPQKPSPAAGAKEPFAIPQAKNGATLVFVIDDAGLHVDNVRKYTALPFPITIAVLPKLAQTKECAAQIRKDGKELMLHQPMQAENLNINPGAGKIAPNMTTYEVAAQIRENLRELGGGVKGFNNHEGSLITGDAIKMGAVLETAAAEGVYFLDSRTTAQSKARQVALERDMRIFERNAPFLDNAVNREEMLAEIYKGLEVANKVGYAIIIGHVDKSANILPALLAEMYPYLLKKGYRFATPSTM